MLYIYIYIYIYIKDTLLIALSIVNWGSYKDMSFTELLFKIGLHF